MNQVLAVFVGGGLGSLFRYAVSVGLQQLSLTSLPIATLSSNLLSTSILGLLIFRTELNDQNFWFYFLAIGFCGGFSTFSTFSMETFQLLKNGQFIWAILNVILSFSLCLFILFILSKQLK